VYISLYNFVLCNLAVYFILLLKKNKLDLVDHPMGQEHTPPHSKQETSASCLTTVPLPNAS